MFTDRIGDRSPVIGAAFWTDSGRQLQCRSLLEFNYQFLPATIINDPTLITSAELILYPVQLASSQNDPGKVIVRRILENWEDSTTIWMNQPATDSFRIADAQKKNRKNKPVSIDVTGLVLDMFKFGNKGFMICNENPPGESNTAEQWFASPKYENEKLRPVLVINFRSWYYSLEQYERESQLMKGRLQTNTPQQTTPVQANRSNN
jgi:hypothetical protein